MEGMIRPVLDLMQTMPSFVYLIPAIYFLGIGLVPAVMATMIYAVPPAIRLTNLGIRLVSPELIEAARAFGTTPMQLLLKIQLPLARPTIMAGVNQTIMMALAMVVVAALVGAGGLGAEVYAGIQQLEFGRGLNGGLAIVVLAVILDRVTQGMAKDPRMQRDS
jgi:glycine betaine/proline transport system permease protein